MESKPYHKNPRVITDSKLDAIKENIKELGDLSGIVHDLNSGEIVCGNQRSRISNINECKISYVKKYKKPTNQGTVAVGYVLWEGQYLNYREVRWNEEQREKANITANALTGDFDHKLLAQFNLKDLRDWNIRPDDIKRIMELDNKNELQYGEAKYPIVPKLSEKYHYVVIFATNEIDLASLENFFELERQISYKNNKVGIGRAVSFEDFNKRVKNINIG